MAVTLDQAKAFLKVDADITEDDSLITMLINAADERIRKSTGKKNNGEGLYDLCILQLVAHWYENRKIYSDKPGAINSIPESVDSLLIHIAGCSDYPEVGDD